MSEIISKVNDDFGLIICRYIQKLAIKYNKIRVKNKIDKTSEFPYLFEFKTPSKNNWIVIISKQSTENIYRGVKSIGITFLNYYLEDDGAFVFIVNPTCQIAGYTPDFFKDYNKRMKLKLVDPLEIVRHYFLSNSMSVSDNFDCGDIIYVLSIVRDGFTLGVLVDEEQDTILNEAFLLKNCKDELLSELRKSFRDHLQESIENELNKKDFDKDKYSRIVDMYKTLVA